MKYIFFSIALAVVMTLGACDKDSSGTEFDLTDTVQSYIIVSKTALNVSPGDTTSVRFTVRVGMSQDVTITYSLSGGIELPNQTAVLSRYSTTVDVAVPIPDDASAPSTAVLTLASATKADGTPLTIGRFGVAANEKVNINIAAP